MPCCCCCLRSRVTKEDGYGSSPRGSHVSSSQAKRLTSDILYDVVQDLQKSNQRWQSDAKWQNEEALEKVEGTYSVWQLIQHYAESFLAMQSVQALIFLLVLADLYLIIHFLFLITDGEAEEEKAFVERANWAILILLTVEICIRIVANPQKFCLSFLNLLEAAVIIVSVVLLGLEASFNACLGRTLRPVVQASRIFRRGVRVPFFMEVMRRRFDRLLDSYIDDIFKKYLGDWLVLHDDNIISHASMGHFRLEKVHIKSEQFRDIHLPLTIHGGFITLFDVNFNFMMGGNITKALPFMKKLNFGSIEITARNIHVVLCPDPHRGEELTRDVVVRRKEKLIDLLNQPLELLACKAAKVNSQRIRAKAREKAMVPKKTSKEPKDALEPRSEGDDDDADTDSEGDDRDERGASVNVIGDMSRLVNGLSEGVQSKLEDAKRGGAEATRHGLNGVARVVQFLKEFGSRQKNRMHQAAMSHIKNQIEAVSVSVANVSLRYEDTDAQLANASGGVKVGAVSFRAERNQETQLKEASDFRAKCTWESCIGLQGDFGSLASFTSQEDQSTQAREVPELWRVAAQIDRLCAWWDKVTETQKNLAQESDVTLNTMDREQTVTEYTELLLEPAWADREYHKQDVRERFQLAVLRAEATAYSEEVTRKEIWNEPPGPEYGHVCSLRTNDPLTDRLLASCVRLPTAEKQCRWLPHHYLLVPMAISIHGCLLLDIQAAQEQVQRSREIAITVQADDAKDAHDAPGKSFLTHAGSGSANVSRKSKASKASASNAGNIDLSDAPTIDIDILVEDVVLRMDRSQLASLARLKEFLVRWYRRNELIQWKPIHKPIVSGQKPVPTRTAGHPMSPLKENVTADWWRYALIKILRTILPFNRKIPSKVIDLLDMKRRWRLQLYLFLLNMKRAENGARVAESWRLKNRMKARLRQLCCMKEQYETEELEGQGAVGARLPKATRQMLNSKWTQVDDYCRQDLQVTLPIQVVLQCRYAAVRIVTQKYLLNDIKAQAPSEEEAFSGDIMKLPTSEHVIASHLNSISKSSNDEAIVRHKSSRKHSRSETKPVTTCIQVRYELKRFLWVVLEDSFEDSVTAYSRPTAKDGVSGLTAHSKMPKIFHSLFSRALIKAKNNQRNSKSNRLVSAISETNSITSTSKSRKVRSTSDKHRSKSRAVSADTPSDLTKQPSRSSNSIEYTSSAFSEAHSHNFPPPGAPQFGSHVPMGPPPEKRHRFTQCRMEHFRAVMCVSAPPDVRKALGPRVSEHADSVGPCIRVSVGRYHFTWAKAPEQAPSLRPILCFYPGGGDGTDNTLQVQRYSFVVQIAKQAKSQAQSNDLREAIAQLKHEVASIILTVVREMLKEVGLTEDTSAGFDELVLERVAKILQHLHHRQDLLRSRFVGRADAYSNFVEPSLAVWEEMKAKLQQLINLTPPGAVRSAKAQDGAQQDYRSELARKVDALRHEVERSVIRVVGGVLQDMGFPGHEDVSMLRISAGSSRSSIKTAATKVLDRLCHRQETHRFFPYQRPSHLVERSPKLQKLVEQVALEAKATMRWAEINALLTELLHLMPTGVSAPARSEEDNEKESGLHRPEHLAYRLQQAWSELENRSATFHSLQEPQEVWAMHVKCCPFKAIYNYPVINELKAMMLLEPPNEEPWMGDLLDHKFSGKAFKNDPLEMKLTKWILEVKLRNNQRQESIGERKKRFGWITRTATNHVPQALGQSQYNEKNFCNIYRVEETSKGVIEVDFDAYGDGSIRLPHPSSSTLGGLSHPLDETGRWKIASKKADLCKFEVDDANRHLKGTLIFHAFNNSITNFVFGGREDFSKARVQVTQPYAGQYDGTQGDGAHDRRQWAWRFKTASGREFRQGVKAAHWEMNFEWDDASHFVRLRHYWPEKMYVIEHVDLTPQKSQVLRWPVGGVFSWSAWWPPEWQPQNSYSNAKSMEPMFTLRSHMEEKPGKQDADLNDDHHRESTQASDDAKPKITSSSVASCLCCTSSASEQKLASHEMSMKSKMISPNGIIDIDSHHSSHLPEAEMGLPSLGGMTSEDGLLRNEGSREASSQVEITRSFHGSMSVVRYAEVITKDTDTRGAKGDIVKKWEDVDQALNFQKHSRKAHIKRKEAFKKAIDAAALRHDMAEKTPPLRQTL